MKVVSSNDCYEIYGNSLDTYDKLPINTYIIRFSKLKGFYLELYPNFEIKEDKIYGIHNQKVEKVLKSFSIFNRSMGVILSGDKGIGKSLFAKLLATKAMNNNLPIIIVDCYYPGITSFIEKIEQKVMFLFDEFDKTFINSSKNEENPQTELLSLFDGTSNGKNLYVITCNNLHHLNEYLINRPGRFHYHFRFNYPSSEEIKEYLKDKLREEYYSEIDKVIVFSHKINLNYDCLRAIAFELNTGEKFETAIQDLNIINLNHETYNINLCFKNGITMNATDIKLDLFNNDEKQYIALYDKDYQNLVDVEFLPSKCVFNSFNNSMIIALEDLNIIYDRDNEYDKALIDKIKTYEVNYLSITKKKSKNIHYTV